MDHTKDCMKPINMVELSKNILFPKTNETNAEHQALRDITQPKIIPDYIKQNFNDACNRRAQLALTTFEACLRSRLYAVSEEQRRMTDPCSAEYMLKSGRIAMLLDLLDDIQTTKKGFEPC